jgi:predicted helicase
LWNRKQKFDFLNKSQHAGDVAWESIHPNDRHIWLTEGLHSEFDTFIPMGTKKAKAAKGKAIDVIFKTYSNGVKTNRDAWVYNFNRNTLAENMSGMIENYNTEVARWGQQTDRDANLDDFVMSDDTKIKWSRELKIKLKRGTTAKYTDDKVRETLYHPFTKSNLYFDRIMNDVVYVFPSIFPTPKIETENQVICVAGIGNRKGFGCLIANMIPGIDLAFEKTQCFPFYTYDEDGTNRRENITDWALAQFRTHYQDDTLTKWDIFHYTYGLLHHPDYRQKYAANLKRDLPRIPTPLAPLDRGVAADFWGFVEAGVRLADLHVTYESQPEYDKLKFVQTPDVPLNWRVEKMKLARDKTSLIYNNFLTLSGIPPKVFEYRLGTRSALEWVVDQYRVKTDKRSGIVNDPNRADDPQYIVRLIGKVIAVSLETVEIIDRLPVLEIR